MISVPAHLLITKYTCHASSHKENTIISSLRKITSNTVTVVFVQLLSYVQLYVTLWSTVHQASLSFTISQSLLILISIEPVMPSSHLILCCPLLFLPSIFSTIRVCRGPAPVDPGNSKVGTVSASLEITYLITDRKGLEN